MFGYIADYNPETQTGTIKSKNEHVAYPFAQDGWMAEVPPEAGDDVVFDIDGTTAININLAGAYMEKPKPVKYKYVAAILGLTFGALGFHRLYLGHYKIALYQILLTAVLVYAHLIIFAPQWGFIEGVLLFAGHIDKDAKGRPLK